MRLNKGVIETQRSALYDREMRLAMLDRQKLLADPSLIQIDA